MAGGLACQLCLLLINPNCIRQAKEIHEFLVAKDRVGAYPLFDAVYHISWENADVTMITAKL